MHHQKLHNKSYAASASPFTVDLREIGNTSDADLVFELADFDIEVFGNTAEVTMSAKGGFLSSPEFEVVDGTFAISGGKQSIENFSIGELIFTSAATPFSVNVVRKIRD